MLDKTSDYGREAFEFVAQLERLTDTDAIMDAMTRVLGRFGFEFFCFNTFPRRHQRFEEVMLAIRVPPEWMKLYLDEQYVHVDPAIRFCKRTVHPFKWKDAPYDPEREPRAAELVQRATEYGLSQGVLVPIPSPTGCEGNVWMGGYQPDLTARSEPMLHLMALYAFDRMRRLRTAGTSAKLPHLTSREREVLAWVAQGKSAWEIGEILNIAKRTVDEHVHMASRKLNAVNRAQAVAIALRERLIEI